MINKAREDEKISQARGTTGKSRGSLLHFKQSIIKASVDFYFSQDHMDGFLSIDNLSHGVRYHQAVHFFIVRLELFNIANHTLGIGHCDSRFERKAGLRIDILGVVSTSIGPPSFLFIYTNSCKTLDYTFGIP